MGNNFVVIRNSISFWVKKSRLTKIAKKGTLEKRQNKNLRK